MDLRVSKQICISDYDFARLVMEKGELSGELLIGRIVTTIQDEGIGAIRPEIDETNINWKVDPETRKTDYLRALAFVHKEIPETVRAPFAVALNWDVDESIAFNIFHHWYAFGYFHGDDFFGLTPSQFRNVVEERLVEHGGKFFCDDRFQTEIHDPATVADMEQWWSKLLNDLSESP